MNVKVCLERGHAPFKDRFGVQRFERGASGPDTTEIDVILNVACRESTKKVAKAIAEGIHRYCQKTF